MGVHYPGPPSLGNLAGLLRWRNRKGGLPTWASKSPDTEAQSELLGPGRPSQGCGDPVPGTLRCGAPGKGTPPQVSRGPVSSLAQGGLPRAAGPILGSLRCGATRKGTPCRASRGPVRAYWLREAFPGLLEPHPGQFEMPCPGEGDSPHASRSPDTGAQSELLTPGRQGRPAQGCGTPTWTLGGMAHQGIGAPTSGQPEP